LEVGLILEGNKPVNGNGKWTEQLEKIKEFKATNREKWAAIRAEWAEEDKQERRRRRL
jgi:hypothetical protein